jgi:hypothetical protein
VIKYQVLDSVDCLSVTSLKVYAVKEERTSDHDYPRKYSASQNREAYS